MFTFSIDCYRISSDLGKSSVVSLADEFQEVCLIVVVRTDHELGCWRGNFIVNQIDKLFVPHGDYHNRCMSCVHDTDSMSLESFLHLQRVYR